jgi:enoyl-CoA hydratase/carnithine racemase
MMVHQDGTVLLREDRGAVALLTLNRPEKLNALSNELLSAMMAALDDIESDPSIRAVSLPAAGGPSVPAPILQRFKSTCRPGRRTR